MPRAKKEVKQAEFKFTLGDREFPVIPFFNSEDSYDKGTEFLILASPIIMKVLALAAASDSPLSQIDPSQAIGAMNVPSLLKELASNLPELTALSCQMSDPDVDGAAVKKLVKTPVSPGMLRAVVLQMKADDLFTQIGLMKQELSGLSDELSSLAG